MKIHILHRYAICALFPAVIILPGCGEKAAESHTSTPAADNSAKNTRDREDATLTAGDQGTTPTDREITQKIRKALVANGDYSTSAKNVKIITVNGKVTLRGPVKTSGEKMGIAMLAKAVAGTSEVDDQLEVKTNP